MPSNLKLITIKAMLYILSNTLDHLMHVNVFAEVINDVINLSMLFVIMCHFKHFRIIVLWNAESSSTVTIR